MSARRRLTSIAAAALTATALAAPAAEAIPAEEYFSGTRSTPAVEPDADALSPTVTRTVDDGFDVGSAAIGAGGAAAVLLLTAAGASAVSHRGRRVGVVR